VTRLVLPIFPLPELTFFPHTLLPLHIFEARYRAMVTDVLPRDKRLALVGLKPGYEQSYAGKPPVHLVGGVGEIVKWERLASGRYNILLRGDARVRIERELPSDTLYRVVSARCLDETPPTRDLGPLVERVRTLCRRLLRAVGRPQEMLDEALREGQEPGAIADQIASAVLPDPRLRQELLETLDADRRLERLVAALEDIVRHVRGKNPRDTG
jgi:Lon protease-like protein